MNLHYLYAALVSYLVGSINPSYIIGKIKGFDIRKKGSGNAGASNAIITMGKGIGAFSTAFDILKAVAVVVLSQKLLNDRIIGEVSGVFCMLGHIFPFYMNFKGGKGLACLGGTILGLDPLLFLILLAASAVIALVTDYICFVPITMSLVFPIIHGIITRDLYAGLVFILSTSVILLRHIENIKRIKCGREMKFSYLWKPEEEEKRVRENN